MEADLDKVDLLLVMGSRLDKIPLAEFARKFSFASRCRQRIADG
jgi:hypothetical protein